MLRALLILIILLNYSQIPIEGVTIDYPKNRHIKERTRTRTDIDLIDPTLRHYIVPREIQFHVDASLQDQLPFFLRCTGSTNSIQFITPPNATNHLSLDTNYSSHTITATLDDNQWHSKLIGRYTCSETINNKKSETSAYVFIFDDSTVFTKRTYPKVFTKRIDQKVFRGTGIHFFNIPCQATSWYAQMSCPDVPDYERCPAQACDSEEQEMNELKCNLPRCKGEEICIPVYYTSGDFEASKTFFDPQIGFALENAIFDSIENFTCMSNYTPNQSSIVPSDSSKSESITVRPSSLTVLPDETITLGCEFSYTKNKDRKIPSLFWFEDVYNLNVTENRTEDYLSQKPIYTRNSSITLSGFEANKMYRFYCVQASEQGIDSISVDINCTSTPLLEFYKTIYPNPPDKVTYGSNSKYKIRMHTIPCSRVDLEITRNGVSLNNDARFELNPIDEDKYNQYPTYMLTIKNITFEDETDLIIQAKSSRLGNSSTIIKPEVTGKPVGQLAFVPNQFPHQVPWRVEDFKSKPNVYPYGIYPNEPYRVVCTVRHRSDIEQPLNVFIQQIPCSVNHCLSDIIDSTCRSTTGQRLATSPATRISDYRTQIVSSDSETLNDSLIGHQYLCCYEKNESTVLATALTALAHNREMFTVREPEYSLVVGDNLTYGCEIHELIYDDLQMVFNDGSENYTRSRSDPKWRLGRTNQSRNIDQLLITNNDTRDTTIEVTTQPLKKLGINGFLQCTAVSKRPDAIPNVNNTYIINVDAHVLLQFKSNKSSPIRIEQDASTNVKLDCSYNGVPQPKITWLKENKPLIINGTTFQLQNNNESIHINRAQASESGNYTCILTNGHDPNLTRSFHLRIKGGGWALIITTGTISACLILILLILLIIVIVKYLKMKKIVDKSYFRLHLDGIEDESQPPMTQLTRIRLPENFATIQQVRTLLSYVNGDILPITKDDFKELGHGQYGVVYQVSLPEVGLVAAKLLPQSIREVERRRDKRTKSGDIEENQEMVAKNQEDKKKKAAEMLIDEIKVMYKAGKHVNIVSLLKVAYPEAKFRNLLRGGIVRDEDSFYLMELSSNGSLESMLKHFLQPSTSESSANKLSLYETLSKQKERGMTIAEALQFCRLTEDDLKLIAYQVASGVDYLNRIQIAHCDIAARNVLVSSKFIMKICDFGLATWTTYKNYREQLAEHDSVQMEKKNNELATHNLTAELAHAFLRASTPDERILLNKPSMKSDVWSFGIFLWTLFLKCRLRPFHQVAEQAKRISNGHSFFHQLASIISEGHVLDYIDYRSEIPDKIYAIIRVCLVDESERPEMSRIRSFLCHQNMLSKQAFEYYRSEYNRYQEENATDGKVIRFGEDQGVSDVPTFEGTKVVENSNAIVQFRQNLYQVNDYCSSPTVPKFSFDEGYIQPKHSSYLEPAAQPLTTAEYLSEGMMPSVQQNHSDFSSGTPIEDQTTLRPLSPLRERKSFEDSYF